MALEFSWRAAMQRCIDRNGVAENSENSFASLRPERETISFEEIAANRRPDAPHRTIGLLSCETGTVNRDLSSAAEALLVANAADHVIASPELVDAYDVKTILQKLLVEKNSLKEVFGERDFVSITLLKAVRSVQQRS